ncbi:MAG: hypothetical protein B7Z55_03510 [Planctomycetales bacterium 12-60-4]|nr:MAG: hypothetical protein B7Z55_03510 [Planctomycetales bacterium 12-60-4]
MGQPPGGFPPNVVARVMRDRPVVTGRPGESLEPADFDAVAARLRTTLTREITRQDVLTSILYPKVFEDFAAHQRKYSDTSGLPTPVFFYGQEPGEEISVDIEAGKRLIVKFLTLGDPHPDGRRTVFFELNGQPRDVTVVDKSLEPDAPTNLKADPGNPNHIGASMPGMIVSVAIQAGAKVAKGQKLLSLEAMKMETNLSAERDGRIAEVLVRPGMQVATGDLLMSYA